MVFASKTYRTLPATAQSIEASAIWQSDRPGDGIARSQSRIVTGFFRNTVTMRYVASRIRNMTPIGQVVLKGR